MKQGRVIWFNISKNYGEAMTHDGRIVFVPGESLTGIKKLRADMIVFMKIGIGNLFGQTRLYSFKTYSLMEL